MWSLNRAGVFVATAKAPSWIKKIASSGSSTVQTWNSDIPAALNCRRKCFVTAWRFAWRPTPSAPIPWAVEASSLADGNQEFGLFSRRWNSVSQWSRYSGRKRLHWFAVSLLNVIRIICSFSRDDLCRDVFSGCMISGPVFSSIKICRCGGTVASTSSMVGHASPAKRASFQTPKSSFCNELNETSEISLSMPVVRCVLESVSYTHLTLPTILLV